MYIEMKRRGFKPTTTTYGTLMSVFVKVENWQNRGKLLLCVHKVYDSFTEYMATVKEHNPRSPELSPMPANAYIQILARTGQCQPAFDVYNAFEDEGPLARDRITYTNMFKIVRPWLRPWRRRASAEAEAPGARCFGLTSHLAHLSSTPGARNRPASRPHRSVRHHPRLGRRSHLRSPAKPRWVALSPLLQDILWLCNKAQKYRLCMHFVQQLMKKNPDTSTTS
ncbi:hypothetical protein OH77DRAFT_43807 [Trametes cingulata]|nr:hypothetical protein OH77DRAFT_43807 [Trametes cingulata]